MRELAARQAQERHRMVLERVADAVEQAAGREVVPGGDGQLDEELAYDLAAYVVTGSPYGQALPELAMGERIALAAAMPRTVLGELERELPALATTLDAAMTVGRTARPTGNTACP
ncbi:hypothetical protein AB0A71_39780 [Kitasatospora aureofaciens]|uniref:hypothetical protein n=1 Tax=Kitasatospora aureofaciens TaxID=1894 RepID=UPI00340F9084